MARSGWPTSRSPPARVIRASASATGTSAARAVSIAASAASITPSSPRTYRFRA